MDDAVLADVPAPLPREPALSPLHQRMAGHCVISELLSVQQAARPRSGLAKLLGVSPLLADARPWYWGVAARSVGSLTWHADDVGRCTASRSRCSATR